MTRIPEDKLSDIIVEYAEAKQAAGTAEQHRDLAHLSNPNIFWNTGHGDWVQATAGDVNHTVSEILDQVITGEAQGGVTLRSIELRLHEFAHPDHPVWELLTEGTRGKLLVYIASN